MPLAKLLRHTHSGLGEFTIVLRFFFYTIKNAERRAVKKINKINNKNLQNCHGIDCKKIILKYRISDYCFPWDDVPLTNHIIHAHIATYMYLLSHITHAFVIIRWFVALRHIHKVYLRTHVLVALYVINHTHIYTYTCAFFRRWNSTRRTRLRLCCTIKCPSLLSAVICLVE